MQDLELSIVMPCLDEAETVAVCIRKARQFLTMANVRGEIILADNGSGDGSPEIAAAEGARIVAVEAKGYGAALLGGIQAAKGTYVIMGDADDSYDFFDLSAFLDKLRQGYDLVVGNRFKGGIRRGAMPFLHRYLGNPILSALGKLFYRVSIQDFHCGLRGFKRQAILDLNLRMTGMEFASEMIAKAAMHGLKITEVPTTLYPDGRSRPPHLRTWHDGWRHLQFLLLFSPRWLFFYPGVFLALAGLSASLWLLPGPRMAGAVELDVHTLFYAALAIILGTQSISLAVFTKVFGSTVGLMPPNQWTNWILRHHTLEKGLMIGAVMILCGLGASLWAFGFWERQAFGHLAVSQTLRWVIPGGMLLVLGFQVIISSFFLSILQLKRR